MGSADHPQSPRFLIPPMCVHVPLHLFLKEVLGLCYHPTAHAHKCSNPKIYINLSILKLLSTALLGGFLSPVVLGGLVAHTRWGPCWYTPHLALLSVVAFAPCFCGGGLRLGSLLR